MIILLISMLLLLIVPTFTEELTSDPLPPMWPDQFKAKFTENFSIPYIWNQTTSGTFYYSWKTKRFRMNRLNSMSNKFCQINGFYSFFRFECDMYIDNNKRYIFYPENDSCCYCCHSDNGCGMLKPDWGNKAEFLGQIEYQGMSAFKWDVKGIQSNIIIETTEADPKARRLLLIDQQPQDSTKFDYNSYTPYVQEEEIALPEQCNNASTCSLFSFCTLFRWF